MPLAGVTARSALVLQLLFVLAELCAEPAFGRRGSVDSRQNLVPERRLGSSVGALGLRAIGGRAKRLAWTPGMSWRGRLDRRPMNVTQ